jgi:hypothetical protein
MRNMKVGCYIYADLCSKDNARRAEGRIAE